MSFYLHIYLYNLYYIYSLFIIYIFIYIIKIKNEIIIISKFYILRKKSYKNQIQRKHNIIQ